MYNPDISKYFVLNVVAAFHGLQGCSFAHIRGLHPTYLTPTPVILQTSALVTTFLAHLEKYIPTVPAHAKYLQQKSNYFPDYRPSFSAVTVSFYPLLYILSCFSKSPQ